MHSEQINKEKTFNPSNSWNLDSTVCMNEEFKNPFIQENCVSNDFGFSAYGFNQNLWINWEQPNEFNCNLTNDLAFNTSIINKSKFWPDSNSILHHEYFPSNIKNMNQAYFDEHKLINCNGHNSKADALVYSSGVLMDLA